MAKSDKVISLRDRMRGMTVGKSQSFDGTKVEIDDMEFEVRRLSYADRRRVSNAAAKFNMKTGDMEGFDQIAYEMGLLLSCVYVPDTDERVFEKGDVEILQKQQIGPDHWMQKLLDAALEMNKAGN